MSSPVRLGLIGVALAVAALLLPAATLAADDTSAGAVAAAERSALALINKERADRGLVALRLDTRLASIAGSRASYMASTGLFSHKERDGDDVFDRIVHAGIAWYGAGEIIAWNTAGELQYSAEYAVQQWMNSAGHKAIIVSKDYNYVAFGLAVASNGRRYWAGVFLKGPDRTGAWTSVSGASKTSLTSAKTRVTVKWTGADTRLQVLTAGLRDYGVQYRRDGGAWNSLGTQAGTSVTRDWWKGHTYDVRIRARDKSGNWGPWQTVSVTP